MRSARRSTAGLHVYDSHQIEYTAAERAAYFLFVVCLRTWSVVDMKQAAQCVLSA